MCLQQVAESWGLVPCVGDFTTLYDRCLRCHLDLFEVWNSPNDRSASPHPGCRIEPIGFGWCIIIIIIIILSLALIVILRSRKRPDAPTQTDRQTDRHGCEGQTLGAPLGPRWVPLLFSVLIHRDQSAPFDVAAPSISGELLFWYKHGARRKRKRWRAFKISKGKKEGGKRRRWHR